MILFNLFILAIKLVLSIVLIIYIKYIIRRLYNGYSGAKWDNQTN